MKSKDSIDLSKLNEVDPNLKKKQAGCKRLTHELPLELDRVIGTGTKSNHSIAINPWDEEIAYPAGSIIVIYKPKENKQCNFLQNSNNKSLNCVTYSSDGRFIAAAEGTTKQPEIIIWSINKSFEVAIGDDIEYEEYCRLSGHKLWIEALQFSPNSNYLISLGDKYDKGLFVWNVATKTRSTWNKLTKWVKDIAFNEYGKYFVTCGIEHLKFWYFDENGEPIRSAFENKSSTKNQVYMMENQAADLSKIDVKDFVGVVCKGDYIYTLSSGGKLWVFNESRKVEKWMNIKVKTAYGLNISDHNLLCNCSDGIVRVFHTETLEHILTLPKPPILGSANQTVGMKKTRSTTSKEEAKYADCLAVALDKIKQRIITVYSDKMILLWDLTSKDKVKVMRAFLGHSSSITGLEIMPDSTFEITRFLTCSTDKTIRLWNLYDYSNSDLQKLVKRNIYCKELEKIIYVSDNYTHFKIKQEEMGDQIEAEKDTSTAKHHSDKKIGSKDNLVQKKSDKDIEMEFKMQLKCLKPSPDGWHVACGDLTGRVAIYDLENSELINQFQAHEQEVACLDYSPFVDQRGDYILVSGSRDRHTHIYSSDGGYIDINTLEGHSSSIVSAKFAFDIDEKEENKRLKLITSGADKAIVFRKIEEYDIITTYHKEVLKNNKVVSMDVSGNKLVCGHDKMVSVTYIPTHTRIYEK